MVVIATTQALYLSDEWRINEQWLSGVCRKGLGRFRPAKNATSLRFIAAQERSAIPDVAFFRRRREAQTKMLILIVEDEPISALSIMAELEHAGHEILGPASTLEEGLELALKHQPRLALVDIDLVHKGDGIELAKQLRELHIAAVFVSAQGHTAYDNRTLALGFIGKPFNPSDLPRSIDVISAILDGKQPPPPVLPRTLQLFN